MQRFAILLALVLIAPAAQAQARPQVPQQPLTLLDAMALGRKRGIAAALARLNAEAARTHIGQQRAEFLPTITGTAAITRQTLNLDEFGLPAASGITDPFNLYTLQLQATQTLFDAATFARLSAAGDSAAAAGLDAQAAGAQAALLAGIAYLQVLGADETVRAREADSAVAAALRAQARELVGAGVSPEIDRIRSDVSFATVQTQLSIARNERNQARLALARALDLPLGDTLQLADSLGLDPLSIPTDPAAAVRYALAHRPELAAERRRTAVLEANRRAIAFENLPSVVARGSIRETGRETDNLGASYALHIGLQIPLFDGLQRQRRHAEATLRLEQQRLREHDLTQQIELDARRAALNLASSREQVALAERRLELAKQELAQARERFRTGVAGSIETTNAQSGLIQARDALIQAQVTYGTARIAAYWSLGMLEQLR